jgi:hypothetical protein
MGTWMSRIYHPATRNKVTLARYIERLAQHAEVGSLGAPASAPSHVGQPNRIFSQRTREGNIPAARAYRRFVALREGGLQFSAEEALHRHDGRRHPPTDALVSLPHPEAAC